MKRLILDEMNIKDIMNPIDHNELLYGLQDNTNVVSHTYNIIPTFLDLYTEDTEDLDYFNNEYIVIAMSGNKIHFKKIPIKK